MGVPGTWIGLFWGMPSKLAIRALLEHILGCSGDGSTCFEKAFWRCLTHIFLITLLPGCRCMLSGGATCGTEFCVG